MQKHFLNAVAEAALASSATRTHVTQTAFLSGALREHAVTLCVGNKLGYWEAMHIYAAAGGACVHIHLHVPTAGVM
jgi:hypothetical protein